MYIHSFTLNRYLVSSCSESGLVLSTGASTKQKRDPSSGNNSDNSRKKMVTNALPSTWNFLGKKRAMSLSYTQLDTHNLNASSTQKWIQDISLRLWIFMPNSFSSSVSFTISVKGKELGKSTGQKHSMSPSSIKTWKHVKNNHITGT